MSRDRSRCTTPFKVAFDTTDDARAALDAHERRLAGYSGSCPDRVYRCRCGYFHISGTDRSRTGQEGRRRHADTNHRNKKASHRRKWSRARDRQL